MEIKGKFDHFNINVTDLARSIDFYGRALGLHEIGRQKAEDGSFELSILKRKDGRCLREFFCYEGCDEGKGYFISTYQGDGSPLPSFAGEPETVAMPDDLDQFARTLWDYLDADNRVSLFARAIDLETGAAQTRLFNKHG